MDTNLSKADVSFWTEGVLEDCGWSVAGAGDVNGDGHDDILIGARRDDKGGHEAGQTYLILSEPFDFIDSDGDGVYDHLDAFPNDIAAFLDTDDDGFPDEWKLGMSADNSTSNPKLMLDVFPDDPLEWADSDVDGYGDNGDAFPDNPLEWVDTDGDGYGDNSDAFPDDAIKWKEEDDDNKEYTTTGFGIIVITVIVLSAVGLILLYRLKRGRR